MAGARGRFDGSRFGAEELIDGRETYHGKQGFEIPTLYRALRRLRDAGLIRIAAPPEPDPDEREVEALAGGGVTAPSRCPRCSAGPLPARRG